MDDFDDELEERVVTFNEQLFSSSDDDEDSVPSSSSRKSAMQQHAMSGRNRYLDIHNELLSKYATNVMIYGPCGDRDLYTHPSSDWSRDIPLGPRATDMNQQSAFLQLPLDIRLIVYEHLFEDFTLSLVTSKNSQPECVYTPPSTVRSRHFSGQYLRSKLQRACDAPRFAESDQIPDRGPHMICRICTTVRDEAVKVLASCTKVLICPELPRTSSRHAEVSLTRRGGSDQVTFVNPDSVLNTRFRGAIKGLCVSLRSVLIAQYSGFPNLQKVSIDGFFDGNAAIGWDDGDDGETLDDDNDSDSASDEIVQGSDEPSDGDLDMQDASTAMNDHEILNAALNAHGLWQMTSPFISPSLGSSANGDGRFLPGTWQASSSAAPSSTLLWNADGFEHDEGRSNAAEFGSHPSSSHHEFASTAPPSASTAGPFDAAIAFDLAMANTDYHLDSPSPSSPASSSLAPVVAGQSIHAASSPNNNLASSPPFTGLFPGDFFPTSEDFRSAIAANFDPPAGPSRAPDLLPPPDRAPGIDFDTVVKARRKWERRVARAEARRKARIAARVARNRRQLESTVLEETLECWGIGQTRLRPLKLHPEWARRWWFELVWLPKHRAEVLQNAEMRPKMIEDVMTALKLGPMAYSTVWRLLQVDRMELLGRLGYSPDSDTGRTLLHILQTGNAPQQHRASNDGSGSNSPEHKHVRAGVAATILTAPGPSSSSTQTGSSGFTNIAPVRRCGTTTSHSAPSTHGAEINVSGNQSSSAEGKGKARADPMSTPAIQPTQVSTRKDKDEDQASFWTVYPLPQPALAVQQAFKLDGRHSDKSYLLATIDLTAGQLINGLVGDDDLACIDVRPSEWLGDLPRGRRTTTAAADEVEDEDEDENRDKEPKIVFPRDDGDETIPSNIMLWPVVDPSDALDDDLDDLF